MRRLVAALVIATVAISLTGCGGSGTTTTTTAVPASTQSAPPPPGSTAATPASTTNLLSPSEAGTGVPFPMSGASVPKEITVRVRKHQPMLVLFYDPTQVSTKDVRTEIDVSLKAYRGLIDLLAFDVTGALPDPVTGMTAKNAEAEQVALLTQSLKVGFTPYMIFVDKNAVITGRFRGYIDRKLLEREILKATQ